MPNSAEELSTEELERILAARRQAASLPEPENTDARSMAESTRDISEVDRGYRMGQAVQARNAQHDQPLLTPTSARAWKKATAETDLPLPSGHVARVRRPGLPKLLKDGVLPDMLTPIAQKAVDAGQDGMPKMDDIKAEFGSAGMMDALFEAVDKITAVCVVEPAVEYHLKRAGDLEGVWGDPEVLMEIPLDQRDPNILYTDDVEFNDKMFIFQYVVGGSRDLEEFRRQTG